RYLELMCCIVMAHSSFLFFKRISYESSVSFINRLTSIQTFYFGIPFIVVFFLCKLNIISFYSVFPIVYNTEAGYGFLLRLAGLYVEGGPFGLFVAYIYILYDSFNKKLNLKNYL